MGGTQIMELRLQERRIHGISLYYPCDHLQEIKDEIGVTVLNDYQLRVLRDHGHELTIIV